MSKMSKRTKTVTMMAWLVELIETHMEKCDDEFPAYDDDGNLKSGVEHDNPDRVPHVVSEARGTKANIKQLRVSNVQDTVFLILDDGTKWALRVHKVENT